MPATPEAEAQSELATLRSMARHLEAAVIDGHRYGEARLPRKARRALERALRAFQDLDEELGPFL